MSNCKKVNGCLREYDWFGHEVNLNFNREGATHNTAIGGGFSLILRIGMVIYIAMNVGKLLFK